MPNAGLLYAKHVEMHCRIRPERKTASYLRVGTVAVIRYVHARNFPTPQESIKYFGVLWNECRVWNMTVIRRETEPPAQAVPCRYGRSGGVDDGGTERPTTPTLLDGRIVRTDRGKMAGSAEPAISTQ